ncbi:MAG TPA: DUF2306 domain-containing protein [Ignavibacteria bacterium]|nr:DUF2306 domain-containing protein [Ignavibacteria bacterium]
MDILFKIFLTLHIMGGSVGLFTGTINLVRKKGDKKHKLTGKIFTWGMLTAGFSALVLSVMHPNYFLFMVGVFTIYMVGTGYRYIYIKLLGSDRRPAIIDRIITASMLLAGLLFIGLGIKNLIAQNYFGIVFIVFGGVGLSFVKSDFDNYKGKAKTKNYWLLAHLQRMTGAYIAATTAFLVVNAKYSPVELPGVVVWLLPTAILTPLIISWSRKYEVK